MSGVGTTRPIQSNWKIDNSRVGVKVALKRDETKKLAELHATAPDDHKVLLCTFTGEGQIVNAWQYFPSLRVEVMGDMDIDEDGANGQGGARAGYMVGDKGRELLANGGMGMRGGRVVGTSDWYDDIVILGDDHQPKVFDGGVIASKTAYRRPGKSPNDPAAYLDAETIPYGVVSPRIRNRAKGVVLGCRMLIMNTKLNLLVEGVCGDSGPSNKIGEGSPAAARAIKINDNPRSGGTDALIVKYEWFPNTPAFVNGERFALIPA